MALLRFPGITIDPHEIKYVKRGISRSRRRPSVRICSKTTVDVVEFETMDEAAAAFDRIGAAMDAARAEASSVATLRELALYVGALAVLR